MRRHHFTVKLLTLALFGLMLGMPGLAFSQPPGVCLGFRNDTKSGVIVQGTTKVNNMSRRGHPLMAPPGRVVFDNNVTAGIRYINIYDGQQPSKQLLADFPVPVQNRDLTISIRVSPTNRERVILVIDNQ
jgi:hypothetical protein